MTKLPEEQEQVGYKKPPKKHQFKKGQSGNPKGRPPDKVLHAVLETVMNEKIQLTVNGEKVTMTKKEAMVQQLVNASMKGKSSATKVLIYLLKNLSEIPPF